MRNRNTLPLLSRAVPVQSPAPSDSFDVYTATPHTGPPIPAIRLTQATPSNPDISLPASLLASASPRKKLVPKKSKLALLAARATTSSSARERDLSDVLRRADAWGEQQDGTCNVTVNGGTVRKKKDKDRDKGGSKSARSTIDIYVDPADDPDIGEIVVVKKKKSRAALEGIRWALGEVTNVGGAGTGTAPAEERVKIKVEEKEKWWSIGRGRRDSKEKEKEKGKLRAKVPSASAVPTLSTLDTGKGVPPRPRNHSLDSGLLLSVPTPTPMPFLTISRATGPAGPVNAQPTTPTDCFSAHPDTQSHYRAQQDLRAPHSLDTQRPRFGSTPGLLNPPDSGYSSGGFSVSSTGGNAGGYLAVPGSNAASTGGGSLAIRALRSVKSLARIGGWASTGSTPDLLSTATGATSATADKKDKDKDKSKKKKDKEKKKPEPLGRVKSSSSSWEVGALSSPSDDPTTTTRFGAMAALGIGRVGDRRESAQSGDRRESTQTGDRRDSAGTLLSVTSSYRTSSSSTTSSSGLSAPGMGVEGRRLSAASGSAYEASGEDTGGWGCVAGGSQEGGGKKKKGSVRWGGVVVGGGENEEKEKKKANKKEKKEKRASTRSKEARRRTPVTAVFPGIGMRRGSGESQHEQHYDQAHSGHHQHPEHNHDPTEHGDDAQSYSDAEEACVHVAVHASLIPPFRVQGRDRVSAVSSCATAISHATTTAEAPAINSHLNTAAESPVPPARPRPRTRPMSEQLLNSSAGAGARPRPHGIVGSIDVGNAFALSVLEAANSDLASLINRLDLEATPDSKASRPASFAITDLTTSSFGVEDSPLRKRALGRGSAASLKPYAHGSTTSLRPYVHGDAVTMRASGVVTVGRAIVPPVPPLVLGRPIVPWAKLKEDVAEAELQRGADVRKPKEREWKAAAPMKREDAHLHAVEDDSVPALQPLRPPRYPRPPHALNGPRIRTSSSDLRARAAPFMRTPSMSSTFGSSLVGLNKSDANNTPTRHARSPSSNTFGGSRPPVRYTLPSVDPETSSPGSVVNASINETPTRPTRGHVRQGSALVPFVKRAVESIEARGAASQEKPVKKQSAGRKSGGSPEEMGAEARRALGFKGTMGVTDDTAEPLNEADEDSDIPDELQVILSHSDDNTRGLFPVDAVEDTLSFAPAGSDSGKVVARLPPSPGLPPAAPLPTPSSTPSVLGGPSLEPSPPAPSLLPFLEPSPSPSSSPSQSQAELPPPTVTVHPVSEDGANEADVDEPNLISSGSDDDTKESFDFTGELQRLNESGGAHRRSFVEQLEQAFKTPSKVGTEALGFELNGFLGGEEKDGEKELAKMVESLNESFNLLKPQASVTSKASYGQLDKAFKFGGKPQAQPQPERDDQVDNSVARELPGVAALSTSPSPKRVVSALPPRRSRASSLSMVEEDSSVLRSIYAHVAQNMETAPGHCTQPSVSLESDTSSKRRARQSYVPAHARSSSDISFSGMSSFGAVRTKFEFGSERPSFFAPSLLASTTHARHESLFSIASISSYGEVINNGSNDPFSYAQDMSEDKDCLASINEAMATFESQRRRKRFSTDSDVSSFYFRAPSQPHVTQRREHGRNQSVVSTTSMNGPPISLYNRSFGHKRNDSAGSANSIANAYGLHGANGGRAAWIRHKQDHSIDSVMSDFSASRLGRPGVGDKMFESAAEHGPLTSISASPPESVAGELTQKSSYDSILDDDRRSTVDSIFDNTGQRSSMSSDSVFGYDAREPIRGNLFPPTLFRPVSVISIGNPGTPHEDDTMISMLGGGHVRRRSIGSSFEASPCVRVEKREKRKHSEFARQVSMYGYEEGSPNKARLVHRESVASSNSSRSKFGEKRMSLAQRGLLHRDSLEDSCLSAEGEEDLTMHSIRSPVFTRPTPSSRSRSRPLVTISQPPDTTPPLSSSEGSGESQSSIDIGRLKILLQTASAGSKCSSSRTRARGHGHRRRASQMSRSSAIATIQEENPGLTNSPSPAHRSTRDSFESTSSYPPSPCEPAPTAEPSVDIVEWDDERMVVGLRKYYALRSEADETVSHSRMVWPDTPFSMHALQTFSVPKHPAGMQALLEHSQKSYVPLPSELRPRRVRSRTSSFNRPSPYPRSMHRPGSAGGSSTKSRRSSIDMSASMSISSSFDKSRALQTIPVHDNNATSPAPALAAITPFSPLNLDLSKSDESIDVNVTQSVIKPAIRPRVGSAARRNALGWTKRKTPKTKTNEGKFANANKENEGHGLLTSPTESLRIVRPRPRGRTAPMPMPTPRSTSLLV